MSVSVILHWVAALNTVAKVDISGIIHLVHKLCGEKKNAWKLKLYFIFSRQESFLTPIVSSASSAILEAHHLLVKDASFYSSSYLAWKICIQNCHSRIIYREEFRQQSRLADGDSRLGINRGVWLQHLQLMGFIELLVLFTNWLRDQDLKGFLAFKSDIDGCTRVPS